MNDSLLFLWNLLHFGPTKIYAHIGVCSITRHLRLVLRPTWHTRQRAHDHYTSNTVIGGKDGDGCKVYMNFCMTLKWSCLIVTWILFKNRLLEVGITQNKETMALRMFTTVDLVYFIMCKDMHKYTTNNWINFWLRARSHMTSHYTWGSMIHYMF